MIRRLMERFDFTVSFCQLLLGIAGIVILNQIKADIDSVGYGLLLAICILYSLEELIDLKRICQDQRIRDAIIRVQQKIQTQDDVRLLIKKGIIRQDDGDNTDN